MKKSLKHLLRQGGKEILIVLTSFFILIVAFPLLKGVFEAKADLKSPDLALSGLPTIQKNSLSALSSPIKAPKVISKISVKITAYSSTPEETDDTPFITAAGTAVRDGIVANNLLPFGTKIRIPDLYGDKIFVVEDRMNARMSDYQFDIWFPTRRSAEIFGVEKTFVEILEN